MEISVKGFIYHKSAEGFADCFDRLGVNKKANKFAVSDGVSKSFFPDVWAELLIEFFLQNEGRINLTDTESYKSIQKEWVKRVGEIVNRPNQKYFVRNFFLQGRPAAATFVGLHFFKENNNFKWEAIALGDSFLFYVPEDLKNITADFEKVVYLSSKKDLKSNNCADLCDSRSVIHKGKIKQKRNDLKGGTFYLMTDALAEWFISEKQEAIDIISEWNTQADFEESITKLRKINLYNDDAAILVIPIKEDNMPEITYKDFSITNFNELLELEKIEKQKSENQNVEVKNTENNSPDQPVIEEKKIDNISKDIIEIKDNKKNEQSQTSDVSDEETKNKNENRKREKGKLGFWEKLVHPFFQYPFWIYREIDERNINNELSTTLEEDKKNIKDTTDDTEKIESKEKHSASTEEKENEKIINRKKRKRIRSGEKENKKDSPTPPDEDISSITDKF